jgi:phenylalanyl-tRNA synthetase beta subunit
MYKIEKGIPSPLTTGKTKYPITKMEIGDSFFIECEDSEKQAKTVGSVCTIIRQYKKLHPDENIGFFVTKKVVENGVKGVRVWKVETKD